jgi:hypothetical protein
MDEQSSEQPEIFERRRRRIRRIGWGIVGLGSTWAFTAALVGGAATRRMDQATFDAALIQRNVAAAILLMGLVTVLVAQRLETLNQWYHWRIDRHSKSTHSTQIHVLFQVATIIFVVLLVWTVVGVFLPWAWRGCLVVVAALAVPALLGLLVLHLRGVPRLFFVGMLLVAIGNLMVTLLVVTVLANAVNSAGALRDLGRFLFPVVTVVWGLAWVLGLFFGLIGAAVAKGTRMRNVDDR